MAYNLVAIATFGALWAIGLWLGGDAPRFMLPLPARLLQYAMLGGGVFLGVMALRSYRAGPFVGWAQLRGEDDDAQPLVTDALHARFRHPLYTAVLLLLWGMADDELALATALWGSLYLWIGSAFEERRLIARYGDAYRRYRAATPRFLPRLR